MVSVLNKEDVNLGNPKNESKSVNPSLVTQDLPPYLEAINESNKMKNDLKVNISIRETPMWLKLSPTTSNDSSNGEIKNEEILKHICKLRKDIEETDTLILILLVVIALLLWSCIIHFNNHNHFNLNLSL
ncbi:uncharacterized protein RJT21DRAFT_4203 [Scheffersomyces amazonensis]|uniref:uncharacterized protein n=1 Tax=Scheffersomyces amazonensis TaxID=1078765 RepID=UPI00315D665D